MRRLSSAGSKGRIMQARVHALHAAAHATHAHRHSLGVCDFHQRRRAAVHHANPHLTQPAVHQPPVGLRARRVSGKAQAVNRAAKDTLHARACGMPRPARTWTRRHQTRAG